MCGECHRSALVWTRKCPTCSQEWSLTQHVDQIAKSNEGIELLGERPYSDPRIRLGVAWIDQITQGGIPRNSALLLGGEPGTGKSTATTVSVCLANVNTSLYFMSEEPLSKLHNRAHELGLAENNRQFQRAFIQYNNNIDDLPRICARLHPDLIIVDSIHSVRSESPRLRGQAGHHTQANYAAKLVVDLCKEFNCAALLISHISNGYFKGGKGIEHWVDAAILMRTQIMKGANGEEEARRVAKVTKGRFCEVTGWRDVTVREWSQSAMRANLQSQSTLPPVDPALQQLLDETSNAGAEKNDELVALDEQNELLDGSEFEIDV